MLMAFASASANDSALAFPLGGDTESLIKASVGDSVLKSTMKDTLLLQSNSKDIALSTKDTLSDNQKKKKRITAFCAFPFPLGFVGAHRIMLGTKPWVPVVYVATFGGCFGLLPLIDFCVILLSKNPEEYENNPNIFMWMK